MACTCQMLLSSKPRLAWMKALTTSLVGEEAVKSAGSGLGNTGAAEGAGADGAVPDGSCATGADGTCCWAAASKTGNENRTSATTLERRALARRADRRIKLFLLKLREGSRLIAYT